MIIAHIFTFCVVFERFFIKHSKKLCDITNLPIINILGSIDDKIECLANINKQIECLANMEYTKIFADRDTFSPLSKIAVMKSGFAFKSDWWTNKGIPVIKIANIDSSLNMKGCSFVSEDKLDLAKEFIANPGDIVLAMTGATLGKFCIIPKHDGVYLVNQRVGKFFIKPNNLPLLFCSLKSKEVSEAIINLASGSAQPNISANDINLLNIKYNENLANKFNEKYNLFFKKIINNVSLIQKLNELKQLYLKKFFN